MTSSFDSPQKRVAARFTHQGEVDEALRRLLRRGVPKERISIRRQFCSETRIVGFLSKADLVKSGMVKGALNGSLLGAALTAIAEVNTFVLPLLGTLTTGPAGAIALGAIGGTILGALGAGLGAMFLLPETAEGEGPALYNTQTQPGQLSLIVEVPESKAGEIFLLLQSVGGQDVTTAAIPPPEAAQPLDIQAEVPAIS